MVLNVCSDPDVLSALRIVRIVVTIIKIAVPIILIVMCMMDFTAAMTDGDLSKVFKTIVRRAVAAIVIFFVPTIVGMLMTTVNDAATADDSCGWATCIGKATGVTQPECSEN